MRGDFSQWNKDKAQNFRGSLHQQGRVLNDRDWNSQTEITYNWQDTAGRDAFGPGVAAVPAELPDSFKVVKAENSGGDVSISMIKGRIWADGLLTELYRDVEPPALPAGIDAVRKASYLNPPPGQIGDLPNDLRDAVILETWLEELNAFQDPEQLIEPALGGIDTTERIQTATRLRLYRMADGETCDSIIPNLVDDFSTKGKLTAKLADEVPVGGDCPVAKGGGYTGFEHQLYRIEIAQTNIVNQSWFKWSQFNGGLVGRGYFDAPNDLVHIRANANAIDHSGLNTFYLEAYSFDSSLGHWKLEYAADQVTLDQNQTLSLAAANVFFGNIPPSPPGVEKTYFFRLWNGVERVNEYTTEKDLPNLVGIKLEFEAEAAGKYMARDYWTFSVRADGLANDTTLIDDLPPQGILYHRVPLAEVNWTSDTVTGDDIEDCRRIFQPLTKLKGCCSYRVGDGVHSHGDFTTIQEAVNALPKEGGEVCVLPGYYEENVRLKQPHNRNISIKGCGPRSVLRAKSNDPSIYVKFGQNIKIESLAIEAHPENIGILLLGQELNFHHKGEEKEAYLKDIVLNTLFIKAAKESAIKGHTFQTMTLTNSTIYMEDVATNSPAVYLAGDDMLVEHNEIRVLPARAVEKDAGLEYSNDPHKFVPAQFASGGLQISGGSERVRIIDNLIVSGTGNGITLGRIDLLAGDERVDSHTPVTNKKPGDDPCKPDPGYIDDGEKTTDGFVPVAGPPVYDILIKFNRIYNMGRNGIGIPTFFSAGPEIDSLAPLKKGMRREILASVTRGLISVIRLMVDDNRIEWCLNVPTAPVPGKMASRMGYGGISLAHVEDLVVRDNCIKDNGPDFLDPICGIFLAAAEGADILRNTILNNGMRTEEVPTAGIVRNGTRGGIWISNSKAPRKSVGRAAGMKVIGFSHNARSGAPAVRIHENVVATELGRSLTLIGKDAMSIVGNQFTSFAIQPISLSDIFSAIFQSGGIDAAIKIELLALLSGNILIFNQGFPVADQSINIGFKGIRTGQVVEENAREVKKQTTEAEATVTEEPSPEKDRRRRAERRYSQRLRAFVENGTVLFTNNKCHQNLTSPEESFVAAAVAIASLDDVGFHNNQCDCDLDSDFMLTNALIFGLTSRTTDNRFRENPQKVFFSAATFGWLDITSDNESVHCLLVFGALYLKRHNLILGETLFGVTGDISEYDGDKFPCDDFLGLLKGFGKNPMPTTGNMMHDFNKID